MAEDRVVAGRDGEAFCQHLARGTGQPKLPPAVRTMLERGLVEIRCDPRSRLPYVFFTEAGVTALRQLARDRRALDPVRFAHIRRELGVSAESDDGAEG